ncbi:MAG: hypothetical protein WBV82_11805 [Myxococcaceae bacterium]
MAMLFEAPGREGDFAGWRLSSPSLDAAPGSLLVQLGPVASGTLGADVVPGFAHVHDGLFTFRRRPNAPLEFRFEPGASICDA